MKKFIKKLVIFIFIIIIIVSFLNKLYIKIVFDKKNISRNYKQFIECNPNSKKTIFFGDSHVARGINPEYVNESFNFAVPSETYDQTYYKIRWILKNYENVDTFVIPYDYHSFSLYRMDSYYDKNHWIRFLSYKELSNITNKSEINLLINANFPIIGKGEDVINFFKGKEDITDMYNGWQKIDENFFDKNNKLLIGRKRVGGQLKDYPNVKNELLLNSFEDSIKLLKENNKNIVLVKYPVTNEYLEAIKEKGIDNNFYEDMEFLFKDYSKIYILDYQTIYKDKPYFFSDSDHLNYKGATELSKKIAEDLDRLNKIF